MKFSRAMLSSYQLVRYSLLLQPDGRLGGIRPNLEDGIRAEELGPRLTVFPAFAFCGMTLAEPALLPGNGQLSASPSEEVDSHEESSTDGWRVTEGAARAERRPPVLLRNCPSECMSEAEPRRGRKYLIFVVSTLKIDNTLCSFCRVRFKVSSV